MTLSKKEWTKALCRGDNVVSLHIPAKISFAEKDIDETLLEAKLFIKKYFPENKRLEKALKEHYNNNKAIYDTHGYYFPKK